MGDPLEYCDEFSDWGGVVSSTTIVRRYGNGSTYSRSAPPSMVRASDGDGADIRSENGSRGN